jgi:hypothetical protein
MKNLTKSLFGSMVLAGIGLVSTVGQAQAAALTGILDFSAIAGGGINIKYLGVDAVNSVGDSVPLTSLDFLPSNPVGSGGTGGVEEDNAFATIFSPPGTGDFAPFVGFVGTVKDLPDADNLVSSGTGFPVPGDPVENFLDFSQATTGEATPGFTFDLATLDPAIFEKTTTGITISIGFTGKFIDEASGDVSLGSGVLGAEVPTDLGIEDFQDLIRANGLESSGLNFSWSGTAEAVEVTPEPSAMAGLVAVGLIAAKAARKSTKKA